VPAFLCFYYNLYFLFGSSTLWFPNRCLQVKTGTKIDVEKITRNIFLRDYRFWVAVSCITLNKKGGDKKNIFILVICGNMRRNRGLYDAKGFEFKQAARMRCSQLCNIIAM
jgi:hypothetical protein